VILRCKVDEGENRRKCSPQDGYLGVWVEEKKTQKKKKKKKKRRSVAKKR
jgi:hypothetical protein